jgi:hypothetical protein
MGSLYKKIGTLILGLLLCLTVFAVDSPLGPRTQPSPVIRPSVGERAPLNIRQNETRPQELNPHQVEGPFVVKGADGNIDQLSLNSGYAPLTLKKNGFADYTVDGPGSMQGSLQRISIGNYFFRGPGDQRLQIGVDRSNGLVFVFSKDQKITYSVDQLKHSLENPASSDKNPQLDQYTLLLAVYQLADAGDL